MPSDSSAGLPGFGDTVTVSVASGDAGGERGEFEVFLRECLAEWFDGASVRRVAPPADGGSGGTPHG